MSNVFSIKEIEQLEAKYNNGRIQEVAYLDEQGNLQRAMVRRFVLLTCQVNNHNKFYEMYDAGSFILVKYGAIGAGAREYLYTFQDKSDLASFWNKKFTEKINKGYKKYESIEDYVSSVGTAHNQ